jgi:hypothetical protein
MSGFASLASLRSSLPAGNGLSAPSPDKGVPDAIPATPAPARRKGGAAALVAEVNRSADEAAAMSRREARTAAKAAEVERQVEADRRRWEEADRLHKRGLTPAQVTEAEQAFMAWAEGVYDLQMEELSARQAAAVRRRNDAEDNAAEAMRLRRIVGEGTVFGDLADVPEHLRHVAAAALVAGGHPPSWPRWVSKPAEPLPAGALGLPAPWQAWHDGGDDGGSDAVGLYGAYSAPFNPAVHAYTPWGELLAAGWRAVTRTPAAERAFTALWRVEDAILTCHEAGKAIESVQAEREALQVECRRRQPAWFHRPIVYRNEGV